MHETMNDPTPWSYTTDRIHQLDIRKQKPYNFPDSSHEMLT